MEDEHRLLSQLLAVLYAYPVLPDDIARRERSRTARSAIRSRTRVAAGAPGGKADFWTSVGGQYKASLDYVVTLSCEAGTR